MNRDIADIRKDYKHLQLNESDAARDPFAQFEQWWQHATTSQIEEVNAMTLATVGKDSVPHARTVLLKDFSDEGFTFFTNYNSSKGKDMQQNPNVSLLFFWIPLERQVRIIGKAERVSDAVSDAYFQSRPASSRIGAWSSPQSMVISSRAVIEEHESNFKKQFGDQIPRPPHWGGYIVKPTSIEFWQGRPSRLHDRLRYRLNDDKSWLIERLAP